MTRWLGCSTLPTGARVVVPFSTSCGLGTPPAEVHPDENAPRQENPGDCGGVHVRRLAQITLTNVSQIARRCAKHSRDDDEQLYPRRRACSASSSATC